MKTMPRKIVSILLTVILILSVFSFVGCAPQKKTVYVDVLIVRWDDGVMYTDEFTMESPGGSYTKQYELCDSFVVEISKPYFENGEEYPVTVPTKSFSDTVIDYPTKPGRYVFREQYKGYDDSTKGGYDYMLTVELLENRPEPEVIFDGGENCIARDGDKFTYKITPGKLPLPSAKVVYNDEVLLEITSEYMGAVTVNAMKYNGVEFVRVDDISTREPGLYQFTFSAQDKLPEEYDGFFRRFRPVFYIELIE